jgi:hypothetical protein
MRCLLKAKRIAKVIEGIFGAESVENLIKLMAGLSVRDWRFGINHDAVLALVITATAANGSRCIANLLLKFQTKPWMLVELLIGN